MLDAASLLSEEEQPGEQNAAPQVSSVLADNAGPDSPIRDTRSQRDDDTGPAAAAPDVATVLADVAMPSRPQVPSMTNDAISARERLARLNQNRWRGRLALLFIAAACILALMMT